MGRGVHQHRLADVELFHLRINPQHQYCERPNGGQSGQRQLTGREVPDRVFQVSHGERTGETGETADRIDRCDPGRA